MTDSPQDQLRVRVARALHEVDKAHAQLAAGEFLTATQLARRAAESMLALVALAEGHVRKEDPKEDRTLEQLAHVLRRADRLPKRTADHIEMVKRIGNRAAHPQASLSDEVTPHDAKGALHALDEVTRWFKEALPPELLPDPAPPAPAAAPVVAVAPPKTSAPKVAAAKAPTKTATASSRPWLRTLGLIGAALAAPVVGFGAMVWVLGVVDPTEPEVTPAPTAPAAEALEADPAADAPPAALDAAAAAERADAVRLRLSADLDLTPDTLAGLGCSDLARSRNWLWVRHGYVLKDATERAALGDVGPGARPGATAREVRRDFTTHDQVNQSLIEQALRAGRCPCPQPLRPDRPCPE